MPLPPAPSADLQLLGVEDCIVWIPVRKRVRVRSVDSASSNDGNSSSDDGS